MDELNAPQENIAPPKERKKFGFILVILIFLLAVLAVWYLQQRRVTDLQSNLNTLSSEKQKINDELVALKQQIDAQKQNKVSVTYPTVIKDTDGRYNNGNSNVIIVSFTAENKGTTQIELNAADFGLKTSGGDVVATYAKTPALIEAIKAFGLPDNLSVFDKYSLKAGEKINGALVFWNTEKDNNTFVITYNGKTTNLKVTKATKVCSRDGTTCN